MSTTQDDALKARRRLSSGTIRQFDSDNATTNPAQLFAQWLPAAVDDGVIGPEAVKRPIRVLHGAGQTVGDQSGEFRGILQCAALGKQSCPIKQFGGLSQRGIVAAVLVRLLQAGDESMIRVEFENALTDRDRLSGRPV